MNPGSGASVAEPPWLLQTRLLAAFINGWDASVLVDVARRLFSGEEEDLGEMYWREPPLRRTHYMIHW